MQSTFSISFYIHQPMRSPGSRHECRGLQLSPVTLRERFRVRLCVTNTNHDNHARAHVHTLSCSFRSSNVVDLPMHYVVEPGCMLPPTWCRTMLAVAPYKTFDHVTCVAHHVVAGVKRVPCADSVPELSCARFAWWLRCSNVRKCAKCAYESNRSDATHSWVALVSHSNQTRS